MNKYIYFHEYILKVLGIFESEARWSAIPKMILFISSLLSIFSIGWAHAIESKNDFDQVAEDLSILLVGSMGLLRYATLIYQRKKIGEMRDVINENMVRGHQDLTSDDHLYLDNYDEVGLKFGKTYGWIIFVSTQGVLLQALLGVFLGYEFNHPVPGVYPFPVNSSATYTITYIHQTIAINCFVFVYLAFDTWFIFLVHHACGHFTLLEKCLENITETDQQLPISIHEKIARCVRLHQNVFEFSADIEDVFNFSSLMQFLVSSIAICTSGYQAITMGFHQPQIFIKHVSSIFEQVILSLIFNWCGQLMEEKSYGVSLAISRSKFYELEPSHQRDLGLILLRAQRPMYMTAGKFFKLSLANFTNFLKMSMSYFTVLTSIQDTEIPDLLA